jgi:hypothetical protein
MKVLDMIADGKITAEEGATLLEALNRSGVCRKEKFWDWHPHHDQHTGDHPSNINNLFTSLRAFSHSILMLKSINI